jgi:hypothetical protein
VMPLRYSPEQGLPVASNSGRDIRHTTQRSFVSFQRWPPVRRLARSVVITKPPFLDDRMWALDRVGRVSDTGLESTRPEASKSPPDRPACAWLVKKDHVREPARKSPAEAGPRCPSTRSAYPAASAAQCGEIAQGGINQGRPKKTHRRLPVRRLMLFLSVVRPASEPNNPLG